MKSLLKLEPVRVFAAVQVLIGAVLNLGQVFGRWDLTVDQLGAVNTVYLAVTALISAVFVRNAVTPVAK